MEKWKSEYMARFDELNVISSEIFETLDKEKAIDEVFNILVLAYLEGVDATNEMLGTEITANEEKAFKSIYKEIGGKNFEQRISEYVDGGTVTDINKVLETEYHRVFNEGIYDGANEIDKKITKTWLTMADDRVREQHSWLDGVKLDLNEPFNIDGHEAMFPGEFGVAELDCNCRCVCDLKYE